MYIYKEIRKFFIQVTTKEIFRFRDFNDAEVCDAPDALSFRSSSTFVIH